jgi:hypothetical protein
MQKMFRLGSMFSTAFISMGFILAAVALGGCNQTSGSSAPVAAVAPQAPAPPNWPKLPEGAACTNDLNHYQTLLDADVATGNLNRPVYNQIETDLGRAANACAAGHDGEARAIVRSTKLQHGYRASS